MLTAESCQWEHLSFRLNWRRGAWPFVSHYSALLMLTPTHTQTCTHKLHTDANSSETHRIPFCLFSLFCVGWLGSVTTAVAMGYREVGGGRGGWGDGRVGSRRWGRLLGQIAAAFHTSRATGCCHIIKYAKYLEVTHLELLCSCVCVCLRACLCVRMSAHFKQRKEKRNNSKNLYLNQSYLSLPVSSGSNRWKFSIGANRLLKLTAQCPAIFISLQKIVRRSL